MVENYNSYGSLSFGTEPAFVGRPEKLRRVVREELVYRYRYDGEDIEYLAIEYRLTPSALREWLEENNIWPVDLNDEQNLKALEREIEQKKRINAVRLAGSILNQTVSTWELLSETEQKVLQAIKASVDSISGLEFVDPRTIASLTKSHVAMVKQQIELKKLAEEQNGLNTLSGMMTRRIEDLFSEIDGLPVIGDECN